MLGAHVDAVLAGDADDVRIGAAGFIASGADAATATQRAYAAVFGMVQQQASMVSFVQLFRMLGMIFLLLIPLVMLMQRPRGKPAMGAH